ncbi:hypothetical protein ES703_54146 [subsurface metagenome]
MVTIQYVPGNIVGGATHTLPATAPDIETVISAEISRLASALDAHAVGATPMAHDDGVNPVAHANTAIADHTLTQPDQHSLTPDVAKGGAISNALAEDGAGALETARGAVVPGLATCIDAHANAALDAHVVSAQPNDHTQAAIVAALADHPVGDIADALIDHATTGGTIIVAATPTRMTTRIIQLNVATELGDLLSLRYLEVGERILVS